jgi:predicted RecB family nuclease
MMHSPTQLTNFLSCHYLGALELAAREGLITKPCFADPTAELLARHGQEHESRYLQLLKKSHDNVVELSRGNFNEQVAQTIAAMKDGADVIYQGALTDEHWRGYSDFLVKTNTPSDLGNYSYNIEDTKLSAEVKGEAIMQLCIYAELVQHIQGRLPDEIVIIGGIENEHFSYNPNDFMSYLNYAKKKFLASTEADLEHVLSELPEPVERCQTCNWRGHCEYNWHEADHLKLVAGSGRLQRKQLQEQEIDTLTKLAERKKTPTLERGSPESMERMHKQAKIQFEGRITKKPHTEFIRPVIEGQGLAALPQPSDGDIWFDIEGDAFIGGKGLEYLFGWIANKSVKTTYHDQWAMNSMEEKEALEKFVQFVMKQRKCYPAMHIYHFANYEPAVIRRLSTRYNVYADEVDDLLRGEVFVDLHRVVRNGLRLSVEGYGLKDIEGHYGFKRKTKLFLASKSRKAAALLLDMEVEIEKELIQIIQNYNEEDCLSTYELHQWLEEKRVELIKAGTEVPRLEALPFDPEEQKEPHKLAILSEALYKMIPADLEALDEEQKVIKSLADLLLWYRREDKSYWWEFFRMKELLGDELIDERKGLAGPFKYLGEVGEVGRSKIYRWKYPPQIFDGARETLHFCGDDGSFSAHDMDLTKGILDVKLGAQRAATFVEKISKARGLFASTKIASPHQIERIKELAEWVIENKGITGEGAFLAGRNLLLRNQLLTGNGSLRNRGESILGCAIRLSDELKPGVILPIQGPPGTGKTYTAAHMICELVQQGKKVGITAQSHAVIMNLMQNVGQINEERYHIDFTAIKQLSSGGSADDLPDWMEGMRSGDIETEEEFDLIGGTAWLWSRAGMENKVDVLFIDEAGQFSLADVIATSHCAGSMALLGDPQQLENVTQGVHPPEIEVSALGYWLGENKVIADDEGLFLENTYRMCPGINAFISETFYEDKLQTTQGLELQKIISKSSLNGSGVRFIPCIHEGNQSSSAEEVAMIQELVHKVLKSGQWVDKEDKKSKLSNNDIMIVAPYNAQVNALKEALPDIQIGTVDKFQGRQAPIVIYSMTTSSPEDAPRGMEFLYSLNRLNVAMSRAQCLAVMVASPALFELSCKTPHQMRLANAFCRFLEVAENN